MSHLPSKVRYLVEAIWGREFKFRSSSFAFINCMSFTNLLFSKVYVVNCWLGFFPVFFAKAIGSSCRQNKITYDGAVMVAMQVRDASFEAARLRALPSVVNGSSAVLRDPREQAFKN
jgi:hypothetical protein